MPEYGKLTQGTYGCPVGCKYCVVTEVERRNRQWRASSLLGVNKSVTILNPPPNLGNEVARRSFYEFPLELLRGDIVGFNGISDPFWPKFRAELDYVLREVPRVAKILSLVTKFEVTDEEMARLAEIPNVRLTVSITGLDTLENTSTRSRLRTLARAKQYGVRAFPIVHRSCRNSVPSATTKSTSRGSAAIHRPQSCGCRRESRLGTPLLRTRNFQRMDGAKLSKTPALPRSAWRIGTSGTSRT